MISRQSYGRQRATSGAAGQPAVTATMGRKVINGVSEQPMPGVALSAETAAQLIGAAVLAPSLHNTQPWRFVVNLSDQTVQIHADPARALRRTDPLGRAVHIACGAALHNLRLAAAHLGTEPVVRLLPAAANPLLLAAIRFAGPHQLRPAERDLYAAIWHRHTSRRPLTGPAVPQQVRAELLEAAAMEGASLRFMDGTEVRRALELSSAADIQLRADRWYLRELGAWTGGARDRDGIPASAIGRKPAGSNRPIRDLGPGRRRAAVASLEEQPQLAMLSTDFDDRADWLRAGQALQRVLLLATHRGLAASPLTQALEVPDAVLARDNYLAGEHPQMILRFGYGQPGTHTPRRPLREVMRIVGAGHASEEVR